MNKTSTFIDNMKLPIHRWLRYSSGFSAIWVENTISEILEERSLSANDIANFIVLDPFAGPGTTLLTADQVGITRVLTVFDAYNKQVEQMCDDISFL